LQIDPKLGDASFVAANVLHSPVFGGNDDAVLDQQ
jgi:hypothetical protein